MVKYMTFRHAAPHLSNKLPPTLRVAYQFDNSSSPSFYPNVTTLRSGHCCRNSVCRLSVTLVHPTQGVDFRQNFFTAVYAGHPLTSVQNFTEIVLGEPLRRER